MNQELPKPLRDALARQAGGEVHPSPDVLTSFMERTLPRHERDVVTEHLASCADCREVVFLASSAAEDVMADEMELVAAAAHQQVPAPVYANASRLPAASLETPRRRWTLGASWAAAAVAVLLVSGVVIVQRFGSENAARQAAPSVAGNRQPPGAAQPSAAGLPAAPEALKQTAPADTFSPKPSAALASRAAAPKSRAEHLSAPVVAAAPASASAPAPAALGGPAPVASVAAGAQNAFAENQAETVSQMRSASPVMKPTMAMRGISAARAQWRISADGQLQRMVAADDWTRVLADQPTTFHAVSVVGGDVWAGGSGGALFHSADGGQHWIRVPLGTSSGAETGTIVSLEFSDSQHGTVITSIGSRWSTSDGGATWTPQ